MRFSLLLVLGLFSSTQLLAWTDPDLDTAFKKFDSSRAQALSHFADFIEKEKQLLKKIVEKNAGPEAYNAALSTMNKISQLLKNPERDLTKDEKSKGEALELMAKLPAGGHERFLKELDLLKHYGGDISKRAVSLLLADRQKSLADLPTPGGNAKKIEDTTAQKKTIESLMDLSSVRAACPTSTQLRDWMKEVEHAIALRDSPAYKKAVEQWKTAETKVRVADLSRVTALTKAYPSWENAKKALSAKNEFDREALKLVQQTFPGATLGTWAEPWPHAEILHFLGGYLNFGNLEGLTLEGFLPPIMRGKYIEVANGLKTNLAAFPKDFPAKKFEDLLDTRFDKLFKTENGNRLLKDGVAELTEAGKKQFAGIFDQNVELVKINLGKLKEMDLLVTKMIEQNKSVNQEMRFREYNRFSKEAEALEKALSVLEKAQEEKAAAEQAMAEASAAVKGLPSIVAFRNELRGCMAALQQTDSGLKSRPSAQEAEAWSSKYREHSEKLRRATAPPK